MSSAHAQHAVVNGDASATPSEAARVVVRAAPRQPVVAPRDPHVAGSVVTRERLSAPGVDAGEALRGEPGVQLFSHGGYGATSTLSLRGASAEHTSVYLGGVRLNDEIGGVADLGRVPTWLLERAEVYRSFAPASAERQSIGGAVFFEPRRPSGSKTGVGALLGSWGTRGVWGWTSVGDADRGAIAGLRTVAADNDYSYADGNGTLFRSDDDRQRQLGNADTALQDGWLMVRERAGAARFSLLANLAVGEQGAPRLGITPSRAARIRQSRALLALTGRAPLGEFATLELATRGSATNVTLDDASRELGLLRQLVELEDARVEQSAVLALELPSDLHVDVNGTFASERLLRTERDYVSENAPTALDGARRAATGNVSAVWPARGLLRLRAHAGAELHDTVAAGEPTARTVVLPWRIGPTLQTERHELYANVGHGARVPLLGELYGITPLVRGNPLLRPERALMAEVGWRWQPVSTPGGVRLWLDSSAFAREVEDIVTWVRNAQGGLVPINARAARVLGAEVVAGAKLGRFVELGASASFLDPRDLDRERAGTNSVLPYRSRLVTTLTARAELPWRTADFGPFSVDARALQMSSRYADPAGLEVVPAQITVDLGARADLLRERMSVRLRVSNLLDAQRFDVVGFPLPGRSFFSNLEVSW